MLLLLAAVAHAVPEEKEKVDKDAAATDLEASESQSYGFGYGTKVADKYSVATGMRSPSHMFSNVEKKILFSLRPRLRHL